jgi:hypothetical protein
MKETLQVLNELESEGVIRRYAIGGAMATLFYPVEPSETIDLDILVLLPPEKHSPLNFLPLDDVHESLKRRGYGWRDEYLLVEGIPVQFLVAEDALVAEAVGEAREVVYDSSVPTRVPTAEHLVAIMLQTGRAKDRGRFEQFLAEVSIDRPRLDDILARHGLTAKFTRWSET